jgi:hypothetical protein
VKRDRNIFSITLGILTAGFNLFPLDYKSSGSTGTG